MQAKLIGTAGFLVAVGIGCASPASAQSSTYWAQFDFSESLTTTSGPVDPSTTPIAFLGYDLANPSSGAVLNVVNNFDIDGLYAASQYNNLLEVTGHEVGGMSVYQGQSVTNTFQIMNVSIGNSYYITGSAPAPTQPLGPDAYAAPVNNPFNGSVALPGFNYPTYAWEQISVPSPSNVLKLTASVTGGSLKGALVDSVTGQYTLSEVSQATNAMGFARLDYLQLMTEYINVIPLPRRVV